MGCGECCIIAHFSYRCRAKYDARHQKNLTRPHEGLKKSRYINEDVINENMKVDADDQNKVFKPWHYPASFYSLLEESSSDDLHVHSDEDCTPSEFSSPKQLQTTSPGHTEKERSIDDNDIRATKSTSISLMDESRDLLLSSENRSAILEEVSKTLDTVDGDNSDESDGSRGGSDESVKSDTEIQEKSALTHSESQKAMLNHGSQPASRTKGGVIIVYAREPISTTESGTQTDNRVESSTQTELVPHSDTTSEMFSALKATQTYDCLPLGQPDEEIAFQEPNKNEGDLTAGEEAKDQRKFEEEEGRIEREELDQRVSESSDVCEPVEILVEKHSAEASPLVYDIEPQSPNASDSNPSNSPRPLPAVFQSDSAYEYDQHTTEDAPQQNSMPSNKTKGSVKINISPATKAHSRESDCVIKLHSQNQLQRSECVIKFNSTDSLSRSDLLQQISRDESLSDFFQSGTTRESSPLSPCISSATYAKEEAELRCCDGDIYYDLPSPMTGMSEEQMSEENSYFLPPTRL